MKTSWNTSFLHWEATPSLRHELKVTLGGTHPRMYRECRVSGAAGAGRNG